MVTNFTINIKFMFLTIFKLVPSSAQLHTAQTGTNSKIGLRHRCNMTIGKTSAERDRGCLASQSACLRYQRRRRWDHRCCCYSCCSPALRNWRCRRQGCSKGASYSQRRLTVVAKQPDLTLEMSATSEEPELFWDLSVLH
ncbi:membrane cofactor protein-like [Grus japonensis]|uniref:Membrane cofactor protein-like n=1 Tax=Grus japonensis TaxID=30415 RepID=A0ABC9XQW6_GRUJA